MKKFILMIALAFSMIAMQSCKDAQFGVTYSLTTTGDAVGNVQFNFPVGHVALNGDADVDVLVTNDTTKTTVFGSVQESDVLALSAALVSEDATVAAEANAVDAWLAQNFSVTTNDADGNYYVHIVGYVRETVTGLTFSIDRVFTNRVNTEVAVAE